MQPPRDPLRSFVFHAADRAVRTVLVAGAVGLFLHLLPGFANPRILDKAVVGPQSLPFTMYFNFDKALVPFLLLACLPSLFRDEARARGLRVAG